MKKQGNSLLIATELFTPSCSQILSRVNAASADGGTEERDAAQGVLIGMNIIRNGRFLLETTEDGGARFTFSI